jgi:hypothetical protein
LAPDVTTTPSGSSSRPARSDSTLAIAFFSSGIPDASV